jgi:spermidine synthase
MKASHTLAETKTPDGARLTLVEHDGSYCIRLNGHDLMNSRTSASELLLGQVGCGRLHAVEAPRILIGGLGLGFTLKSVLEHSPSDARIEVVELFPEIIEWNRHHLHQLHGHLLDDSRVEARAEDVFHTLKRGGAEAWDAILLDIDNGPSPMVQKANSRIYDRSGLDLLARSVKVTGRVAIWSAARDVKFEDRMKRAHFSVEAVPAKIYPQAKRDAYTIYLADPIRL